MKSKKLTLPSTKISIMDEFKDKNPNPKAKGELPVKGRKMFAGNVPMKSRPLKKKKSMY